MPVAEINTSTFDKDFGSNEPNTRPVSTADTPSDENVVSVVRTGDGVVIDTKPVDVPVDLVKNKLRDLDEKIFGDSSISFSVSNSTKGTTILVDGVSTKKPTTSIISFKVKELLSPKIISLESPSGKSEDAYKIHVSRTQFLNLTRSLVVYKRNGSRWDVVQEFDNANSTGLVKLEFNVNDIVIEPVIMDTTVEIVTDLATAEDITYVASDDYVFYGQHDPKKSLPKEGTTKLDLTSSPQKWIEFSDHHLISETSHEIKYFLLKPGSNSEILVENAFRHILSPGHTKIRITSKKIGNLDEYGSPVVNIDRDSYTFNLNKQSEQQGGDFPINFTTLHADSIEYTIGKTVRTVDSRRGTIELNKSDFNNGIGQYTLYVRSYSDLFGFGKTKKVTLNLVSESYLPGPDITHINYPDVITGRDFRGYNEDFKISWQSVNTNYVEIYVNSYKNKFAIAKASSDGSLKLNVRDVLQTGLIKFGEDTDIIEFDLILIPFNTEGDRLSEGIHEKITIKFDKGDLKLRRNAVLNDIRDSFVKNLDASAFDSEISQYLTHNLHLGDGDTKLVSTWGVDTETFSTFTENELTGEQTKTDEVRSLILKLYEPLPKHIQPNHRLWLSKIQSIPIIDIITINETSHDSCTILQPNFKLDLGDSVGFQILDELVASGSVSSSELANQYLGTNEFSLDILNLNYMSEDEYLWNNFVKYSSATERVENFYYKVQAIELHNAQLDKLNLTQDAHSSIAVQREIKKVTEQIDNLKRGFDSFEKQLYSVDGNLTYPGAGETSLSGSSHIDTLNWLGDIKLSADSYDSDNMNALVKNIPLHITDDVSSDDFTLFFNMVGQHFDVMSNYIDGIVDSKKIVHNHDSGITNDLTYHMLESLGWDADMGVNSQYLWEYAFGKNEDGTQQTEWSGKRRQQEIWRRLLNNLPYLYKHKGTKRALSAAMSCYGIPTSMLTVMEFGGTSNENGESSNSITFDDRTASVKFTGIETITVPYEQVDPTANPGMVSTDPLIRPAGVEFRIKPNEIKESVLVATDDVDGWSLKLIPTVGVMAKLEFTIKAADGNMMSVFGSEIPFFNEEYSQIMIQRSTDVAGYDIFDVYSKQSSGDRITNKSHIQISTITNGNSSWHNGNLLCIGSAPDLQGSFSGEIDEFRYWKVPLNEVRIENHTKMPDAIDGNSTESSSDDLLFRMDFEYPKNLNVDTTIKNVAIHEIYGNDYENFGTALNFTDITNYPFNYSTYERSVTATVPSTGIGFGNKIRFGEQTYETNLKFGEFSGATSTDDSNDSNKLGLFFSPNREVNMDILKSLGSFNIDNYIGNPNDEYSDTYSDLDDLRTNYFKRFDLNIYEYIQLVRYIDQTLFTTLESLVPGRANVASGLLIEPHLLERSKQRKLKPIAENLLESVNIDTSEDQEINLTYSDYNIKLQTTEEIDIKSDQVTRGTDISTGDVANFTGEKVSLDVTLTHENENIIESNVEINNANVDAEMRSELQGWYDSQQFTEVGMDPNSIANAGFGVTGENGHTIKTFVDLWGEKQQIRKQIYKLKQKYVVDIPENINPNDASMGRHYVPVTKYKYTITTLNYGQPVPVVFGDIVEVTPLNGYFDSHYKSVGDLTSGLERSYHIGSKQTSETTLDGKSSVQTFSTNPNTLKVNDTGRGSGSPILQVD